MVLPVCLAVFADPQRVTVAGDLLLNLLVAAEYCLITNAGHTGLQIDMGDTHVETMEGIAVLVSNGHVAASRAGDLGLELTCDLTADLAGDATHGIGGVIVGSGVHTVQCAFAGEVAGEGVAVKVHVDIAVNGHIFYDRCDQLDVAGGSVNCLGHGDEFLAAFGAVKDLRHIAEGLQCAGFGSFDVTILACNEVTQIGFAAIFGEDAGVVVAKTDLCALGQKRPTTQPSLAH